MGDEGYRIGEVEEELKRYHLNQRVIEPWDIFLDVLLEKRVRGLKNKNEELKDQLEFSKLSNPEMNLRYSKLVNSNRRKMNCLREENKKLKEQLREKENKLKAIEMMLKADYSTSIDILKYINLRLGGTDEKII